MVHHFNIQIAERYGVDAAIIINHFDYWLTKNKANKSNFYEGKFWTYNSVKAFTKIFSYYTPHQIRRYLDKLIEENVIEVGNFNDSRYDRTSWFTFTDDFLKTHSSKLQYSHFDLAKLPNESGKNAKPIPDIIPDNNSDKETNVENPTDVSTMPKMPFVQLVLDELNAIRKKYMPSAMDLKINKKRGRLVALRKKEFDALWPNRDFVKACRLIFETKGEEWAGQEYFKYFQPETLLNEDNFLKYLEQAIDKSKTVISTKPKNEQPKIESPFKPRKIHN